MLSEAYPKVYLRVMRQCEIVPTYCGKPSELDKRRRILPLTLMKNGWTVANLFRAEGSHFYLVGGLNVSVLFFSFLTRSS